MPKHFRLAAHDIKRIAVGLGSCIASDRITVDGMKVGYLYREAPDNEIDSGWRFFAGDESEEYSADADHFAVYDVNTIANYDPAITVLLETPAPCAFDRDGTDHFVPVPPPSES